MNKDEIFKEADKIIYKHKNKQLNKPVVSGSLLIRSLSLLEEMIDNHDADAVRMTDVHYTEVKKLIKDIRRSKRLQ
ncbi:MAG: hypothetical protein ACYC6J_09275 [Coriobacteriia bacterium]